MFAVLEAELADGGGRGQWFGYLGYAARPDLPAAPRPDLPDAVWMRPSHVRLFDHAAGAGARSCARARSPATGDRRTTPDPTTPRRSPRVQEHLHAGNTYEVNLTYRARGRAATPTRPTTYLRLRELNPAPYAGFLQHDVDGARAWLLSSSPERYALVTADRTMETKPIKGTTPRGATRGRRRRAARAAGAATRSTAPRT